MSADSEKVNLLLAKWEELREAGQESSPEEVCRESPELVEAVRQKIEAIRAIEARFPRVRRRANERESPKGTHSHRDAREVPTRLTNEEGPTPRITASRESPRNYRARLFQALPWLLVVLLAGALAIVVRQWRQSEQRLSQRAANHPQPDYLHAPRYQLQLARHWSSLGTLLMEDERFADAETYYRQALKAHEDLAAREPGNEQLTAERASMILNLGRACSSLNKTDEAMTLIQRSVQILRQLLHEHPGNADYACSLGVGLHNLAKLSMTMNRMKQARKLLEEAMDLQSAALALRPRDPNYSRCLREHCDALAELHHQQGDHAAQAIDARMSRATADDR